MMGDYFSLSKQTFISFFVSSHHPPQRFGRTRDKALGSLIGRATKGLFVSIADYTGNAGDKVNDVD